MTTQKIWFITGASRGFGKLWAEAALKRGDKVAATARDPKTLDAMVAAFGKALLPLRVDVTDHASVLEAVNLAHRNFGRLDVVLSNAGYGVMGAVEETTLAEARDAFETNVIGTLSVIQAALPLLRGQGSGHIISVSSLAGLITFPLGGAYHAAKFAVEGLMESLAQEVAGFGIHTTLIEPGPFATEFMSEKSLKQAQQNSAYDGMRDQLMAQFNPDAFEDPRRTIAAVMKIVDALRPPQHVIFGSHLPIVKKVYAARMEAWDEWAWDKISAPDSAGI